MRDTRAGLEDHCCFPEAAGSPASLYPESTALGARLHHFWGGGVRQSAGFFHLQCSWGSKALGELTRSDASGCEDVAEVLENAQRPSQGSPEAHGPCLRRKDPSLHHLLIPSLTHSLIHSFIHSSHPSWLHRGAEAEKQRLVIGIRDHFRALAPMEPSSLDQLWRRSHHSDGHQPWTKGIPHFRSLHKCCWNRWVFPLRGFRTVPSITVRGQALPGESQHTVSGPLGDPTGMRPVAGVPWAQACAPPSRTSPGRLQACRWEGEVCRG